MAEPAGNSLKSQSRQRSDNGREESRGSGNGQAGDQRFGDQGIGKGLAIPLQRKALPVHGIAPGAEGEADDQGDGAIEKQVNQDGVNPHGYTMATRRWPLLPSTKRM